MQTLLIHITPNEDLNNLLKNSNLGVNKFLNIKYIAFYKQFQNTEKENYIKKIHYNYDEILDLKSIKSYLPKNLNTIKIYNFLDMMLSDPKTMSILDRTSYDRKSFFITSNTKRIRSLSILYFQAIKFLKKINPKVYILNSTPHGISEYVLKWACFALDIDVIYLQHSLLNWRYYAILEKNNNRYLLNRGERWNSKDQLYYKNLKKNLNNNNYVHNIELKRRNTSKKYFTFASELKNFWKRPDLIINKFIIHNYYKNITQKFKLPKYGYIFFPLHYGPERTIIPEGGKYFEQYRAIHEIRTKFDKKIKIVVKEHPSLFSLYCHWKERNIDFYKSIQELGNVTFAPINYSLVKLIKNSILTISINGSTALEAIILKKYSSYMSNQRFFGTESKNFYAFNDLSERKIFSYSKKNSKTNDLNKNWFENYTFAPQQADIIPPTKKIINKQYNEYVHILTFERSKIYNRLITELIKIYKKKDIRKNFRKINNL